MNLYTQCLRVVVADDDMQTSELPYTIQEDIAVMKVFKKNLEEWQRVQCLLYNQDIIIEAWEYIADISMWGCDEDCHIDHTKYEEKLETVLQEKEDLNMWVDSIETDVNHVKDEVPVYLNDLMKSMECTYNYLYKN